MTVGSDDIAIINEAVLLYIMTTVCYDDSLLLLQCAMATVWSYSSMPKWQ
jgi:hypothetical protein